MIFFPRTTDEVLQTEGEIRAGGTDLQHRRALGISAGPLIDLRDLRGLDGLRVDPDGSLHIGSMVSIAALAESALVRERWPALADAAGHIANPQIRAVATVAGNLLQRSRCWYYRNPAISCYKKGGDACPARGGDHSTGVCFDLSPCVAPHPSTLAAALCAYDAQAVAAGADAIPIDALFGCDASSEHLLGSGMLLERVLVPPPAPDERASYMRLCARRRADWPLVEVTARLALDGGRVRFARITAGAVAPMPLRLSDAEEALLGASFDSAAIARAAARATERAAPLPQTAYKLDLLREAVALTLEVIAERAAQADAHPAHPLLDREVNYARA